jgi:membrane protease YdiL (CAAX protease family)
MSCYCLDLFVPQVLISAAAFAASHLLIADLQSCLALFFLGIVLGTTAVAARGNMIAPLTAHSAYNAILFAAALQPKF